MMKLKIFTNHFFPENFKINELSQEFSRYYKVDVITQVPNYSKGVFFEGYSWFKRREEYVDKVAVKRLVVIPRKRGFVFLLLNYLSYIVSSFFYSFLTKDKADHVFAYITSPIFISWAALRYAEKNKIKSTLYLLDLWPGSLTAILGIKNKNIINYLEKICIRIYERFDTIIVSSHGFIEVLVDYGINKNKIYYIPQHAEHVVSSHFSKGAPTNTLRIVFTGNVGEAQGLNVLVDAAKILKDKNVSGVHFTVVGDGSYRKTLENQISFLKLDSYFSFLGYVEAGEVQGILKKNDFGFVSLSDQDIFNRTLPAKVQTYMANSMPILASANGEIPWLINKANCGFSVSAGDPAALANLIVKVMLLEKTTLEKMSENSYNYSVENFNKELIVKEFIKIMREGK